MCTAISVNCKNHYFGRNLDFEHDFGEKITITPRNYKLTFSNGREFNTHYAVIGMALIENEYPLYFDATNEKGLSVAGLNFPGYAHYNEQEFGKDNVAPFELILWILSQCACVSECCKLIENINITNRNYSDELPVTPLHWIVADKSSSITIEPTIRGVKVYENPVGVLTNSPGFDYQIFNLNNFMSLSEKTPENMFFKDFKLSAYSRGMGMLGIPGDLSSMSRFVRACYVREKSIFADDEKQNISQFFHILYSVYQQNGCVEVGEGLFEKTNYTSCCNTDLGIYYYTTYKNSAVCAVDMHRENLESDLLISFELEKETQIFMKN